MSVQVLTGARAILKIAGAKVAACTGVDLSETIQYEPVRTLDLLEVYEFCETAYDCSFTCDTVKVIGQSPTQIGIFPHVDLLSILNQPELVAEIYDAKTGQLCSVVEAVKPSGNNYSVRAGAVVANNLTFVAKRIKDVAEASPSVFNSGTPTGGTPVI